MALAEACPCEGVEVGSGHAINCIARLATSFFVLHSLHDARSGRLNPMFPPVSYTASSKIRSAPCIKTF
jgi:hypothetical protein